jgi:hypothetical protein
VEALIEWLWRGPPAAHVQDVSSMDVDLGELGEMPSAFGTR